MFQWSLISCVLLLALTALTSSFIVISCVRLVSGASSAAVFVSGASLVGAIRGRRGGLGPTEIYFAGVGLGIAASAVLNLPIVTLAGSWRLDWLVLAILALICVTPAWWAASTLLDQADSPGGKAERYADLLFIAYGVFGLGYIGYMTFVAAFFVGLSSRAGELVGRFWICLGVSAVGAPLIWRPLVSRAGYRFGLVVFCSISGLACLVPVFTPGLLLAFASVVLFGASFLSAMSAVTVVVTSQTDEGRRTATIAVMTVWFAVGQVLGPLAPGIIADAAGLGSALVFSAAMLLLAGLLALLWTRRQPIVSRRAG